MLVKKEKKKKENNQTCVVNPVVTINFWRWSAVSADTEVRGQISLSKFFSSKLCEI